MAVLEFLSLPLLVLLPLAFMVIIPNVFHHRRRHLPPSPIAMPLIGHFHLLSPVLHASFRDLSLRWGPIYSIRLGALPCVVVSSPELGRELLMTNELSFTSRIEAFAISRLTYATSTAFNPYDATFKFIHRLTMNEFLGNRPVSAHAPLRARELRRFLRVLAEKSERGEASNLTEELQNLTYAVILQMVCGVDRSLVEDPEAKTAVYGMLTIFGNFSVSDFVWILRWLDLQGSWKRTEKIFRKFDVLMETVLVEREELRRKQKEVGKELGVKDGNFLDILLDHLEVHKDENVQFNRPRDLILAGLETTAATVEWMLSELINNPTVLEKARQEIDRVVGQTRLVNESDGPNLPYMQAIIKEVLRLHPVSPVITRKCVKEHKVGKYVIPVDTILFVNNWSISRDPNYWESPLEFRPERFLQVRKEGSKTGTDIKGQHFELLPFGTGRRMCPGMNFSLQMLPIVAATIIQCFDLKIVDSLGNKSDGHGSTVNMEEGPGTIVPKLHQLVCVPVARLNPLSVILEPEL
ncbi:Licodione synthase [Morus notabilis]|uniref:Licodione synthase n=1 Tax=Morus notabilis TaxID=981085 RepID=W9RPI3_9ROSA|nr:Licodione synthase [Morus notabilis]